MYDIPVFWLVNVDDIPNICGRRISQTGRRGSVADAFISANSL